MKKPQKSGYSSSCVEQDSYREVFRLHALVGLVLDAQVVQFLLEGGRVEEQVDDGVQAAAHSHAMRRELATVGVVNVDASEQRLRSWFLLKHSGKSNQIKFLDSCHGVSVVVISVRHVHTKVNVKRQMYMCTLNS